MNRKEIDAPKYKLNCRGCGNEFETQWARQRYCHDPCKPKKVFTQVIPKGKHKINCAGCKEDFITIYAHRKYCHDPCMPPAKKYTPTSRVPVTKAQIEESGNLSKIWLSRPL